MTERSARRVEVGTTSTRTAEFDAFGPWVDEVQNADGVPRLYRDHAIDFTVAELVLKVPRDIERRLANPAMDLYDHLLILEPGQLTALTRQPGGGYATRRIALAEIGGASRVINLLRGELQFYCADGPPLTIGFNAAGREPIDRLVEMVRARSWRAPQPGSTVEPVETSPSVELVETSPTTSVLDLALPGNDEILGNDARADLGGDPAYRVLAAHPRMNVRSMRTGWRGLLDALRPMVLHGMVVCSDGRELRMFTRKSALTRRSLAEYSDARHSLAIHRIGRATFSPHPLYEGVTVVRLGTVELAVPAGSSAEAVLRTLPA